MLCYAWFANRVPENKEFTVMNDNLSHTSWKCKYHIVFAPKYRRKNIYGALKTDIGKILRQLCELKKVEILEAEACPDHIHMLVSIPPNISVSQFMGYLKGKSSLMIFDRHANLKYKYGSRHFWCRGYYVNTSRSGYSCDCSVYSKSIGRRPGVRPNDFYRIYRPVYG